MDRHASSPLPSSPSLPSSDPHNNAVPEHPTSTDTMDGTREAASQQTSSSLPALPDSTPAQERHPKGKRKRTAAKDKSILEAAYNNNPKPDKAARLELVQRVSLSEKEVQIWFQNRRQNDRRKSRPLSPQEIAALRYGGMQILSSDPLPYTSSGILGSSNTSPFQVLSFSEPESTSPVGSETGRPNSSDEAEGNAAAAARPTVPGNSPTQSNEPSPRATESFDDSRPFSQSLPSSVGYLSNRWNTGSSFSSPSTLGHRAGEDSIRLEPFRPSSSSPDTSSASVLPPPSSQGSQVRISLSLDGKAEVISAINSPPHLPLPRPSSGSISSIPPIRRPSLQRSHSVQPVITLPPISALTGSLPNTGSRALPPRLTRGRSRDVHAWEFCCDADNQEDALIAQAKHESSGSAIAVISLLRSTSSAGSTALQPSSSSKRNAPVGKASARQGVSKKPKLGRSSSSIARLQTNVDDDENVSADATKEADGAVEGKGKGSITMLASAAGGDSDKENWSPDEDGNPQNRHRSRHHQAPGNGRRPLPSGGATAAVTQLPKPRRTAGRPLQEHRIPPSLAANRAYTAPSPGLRTGKGRDRSPLEIFEDSDRNSPAPEVPDLEVERFMRGEVSPSKKPDVDAVAGLLSLSQGNWR